MVSKHEAVTPELVRRLAQFVSLPLTPGREAVIAPLLDAWLKDANALSEKMSDAAHQSLLPATVFSHTDSHDVEVV
jgi:hypothetical protein